MSREELVTTFLLIAVAAAAAYATWRQARASDRIAELTRELKRTAEQALDANTRQAQAAVDALVETRRQGQLAGLPFFDVKEPIVFFRADRTKDAHADYSGQPYGLVARVTFANTGGDIAVGPHLAVRGGTLRSSYDEVEVARSRTVASVAPGEEVWVELGLNAIAQDGGVNVDGGGNQTGPPFTHPWLEITLDTRSPRGATVRQVFEWHANHRWHASQSRVWELVRVEIAPALEAGETIVVSVGDSGHARPTAQGALGDPGSRLGRRG